MFKYENAASFYNKIPRDNKEEKEDFIYSLLCFAVLKYISKDIRSSISAVEDILLLANNNSPREWECIEWAIFFLLYIKGISPDNSEIYVYAYKRKLFRYYSKNKKRFKMFYKYLDERKISKEIKGSLKRRWNKKNLDIFLNSLDASKKSGNLILSWTDSIEVFLESVLLLYFVGNVEVEFIESTEKYMSELLEVIGGENNTIPFTSFYN